MNNAPANAPSINANRTNAQTDVNNVRVNIRRGISPRRWWCLTKKERTRIATLLLLKLFILVIMNVILSIFIMHTTQNYRMLQKGRLAKHASSESALAKSYRQWKINLDFVDQLDYVMKRDLLVNLNETLFIDEIEAINHGQPLVIEAGDGKDKSPRLVLKSFNKDVENSLTICKFEKLNFITL